LGDFCCKLHLWNCNLFPVLEYRKTFPEIGLRECMSVTILQL